MLKRIRNPLRAQTPKASVPEGLRLYAIGDVHGRLDLLDKLLDQIDADDAGRGEATPQLIFLGDLIDRGPDSAGVVERASQLAVELPSTRLLLGNHEEVFLQLLDGDINALPFFCRIGGRETILSYGISERDFAQLDAGDLLARLVRSVPPRHVAFLRGFEDMVVAGDYAFVHAGIQPGVPLEVQQPSNLRWIREPFLNHSAPHTKIIVHGHSVTGEVDLRSNRIGIDTGAYATGHLTAIGLEGSERWFLST